MTRWYSPCGYVRTDLGITAGNTPDCPECGSGSWSTMDWSKHRDRPHQMAGTCWCAPVTNYEDPITGDRVFVHRTIGDRMATFSDDLTDDQREEGAAWAERQ